MGNTDSRGHGTGTIVLTAPALATARAGRDDDSRGRKVASALASWDGLFEPVRSARAREDATTGVFEADAVGQAHVPGASHRDIR
jgi:hypothetical protein